MSQNGGCRGDIEYLNSYTAVAAVGKLSSTVQVQRYSGWLESWFKATYHATVHVYVSQGNMETLVM